MPDTTDPASDRTTALYDAIEAFQRTHRTVGGLQHAQIRGLLAEHLDRALPATAPPAADRAAALREEAAGIRAHCPDHLDSESARGSWMACHCAVADDMERRVADEEQQDETQPREEPGSALARYITEQPVSVVQAMLRILGWPPLRFELVDDPATPPAVVAEPGKEA